MRLRDAVTNSHEAKLNLGAVTWCTLVGPGGSGKGASSALPARPHKPFHQKHLQATNGNPPGAAAAILSLDSPVQPI